MKNDELEAKCLCGWEGKDSELKFVPIIIEDGTRIEIEACPKCERTDKWMDYDREKNEWYHV
jgi:hypothetical protein